MAEEPLPSGWLPPKPPAFPAPPTAPRPPRGGWPPPGRPDRPDRPRRDEPAAPSSPTAVTGITLGGAAIVLLLLSAGVWFPLTIGFSIGAILLGTQAQRRMAAGQPGRASQARTAILLGRVGLGLAALAAIVWMILAVNGITPAELQEMLERQRDRMQQG